MTLFRSDVENYLKITNKQYLKNVYLLYFFHPRLMPIGLFRISAWFYKIHLKPLAHVVSLINQIVFGLEISPRVKVGKSFFMPHCRSTVIGANEIGDSVTIYQNVTIGAKFLDFNYNASSRPIIGSNVVIGTGATVLGPIVVSNGSRIGPHTLVDFSTAENQRVSSSSYSGKKVSQSVIETFKNDILIGSKFEPRGQVRSVQNVILLAGSCTILINNGNYREKIVLSENSNCLKLSGNWWLEIATCSSDCQIILAGENSTNDIHWVQNYDEFLTLVESSNVGGEFRAR